MTGFIMKIVGRLVVEWEEAHLDGDIRNMSIDARNRFWEAEYKKDLIGVAKSMWVPVKSVVDWHAMFEIDIDELNAESKMKILRARRVLLVKFVAACDITFLYRYDEENNLEDYLREGDGLIPRKVSCTLSTACRIVANHVE
jgi:hypothetical protein